MLTWRKSVTSQIDDDVGPVLLPADLRLRGPFSSTGELDSRAAGCRRVDRRRRDRDRNRKFLDVEKSRNLRNAETVFGAAVVGAAVVDPDILDPEMLA